MSLAVFVIFHLVVLVGVFSFAYIDFYAKKGSVLACLGIKKFFCRILSHIALHDHFMH